MASHRCRICSAAMSARDGHRECPMCLGAAHILEDVENPCSAACDLSRGERQRRATLLCGYVQEARRERRRSPDQPSSSGRWGHKRKQKRRHSDDRRREATYRPAQAEAPSPAKRPATSAAAGSSSTESLQILSALQALAQRMDRLEGQRDPSPASLPPGQEATLSSRPEGHDEEEEQGDVDVISLDASHSQAEFTAGGGKPEGDQHSASAELADRSTEGEELPVSSLMSRVLSAANILGLQPPTPAPAPSGGIWEGVPRATPPPPIPVPEDYTTMLKSSWGKLAQRPQYNAGCRQLATATYPAETGLGDMPPVEPAMAALTSLGLARVAPIPRCPRKECAKTDRLATRCFNAAARAARMGNALAITLAALRRTLSPDDQDARALVDAALSSHSQLTRDVGDAMGSAVLCRRQVWLAQTSLPDAIKQELVNLPVAPGHVFHPGSQDVLDHAEHTAAAREAVQRVCRKSTPIASRAPVGRFRSRQSNRPPPERSYSGPPREWRFRAPGRSSAPNPRPRGRKEPQRGTGRGAGGGAGRGGGPA